MKSFLTLRKILLLDVNLCLGPCVFVIYVFGCTYLYLYLCRVTPPNNQNMETYTGLTSQTFKKRWDQHMSDCRRGEGTTLASHIGELNAKGIDVDLITHLHWSIKKQTTKFNPVSNQCMLCLWEKYFILHEPWDASLNKRTEIFGFCRHKECWLLVNN